MSLDTAERAVREGDLDAALSNLQEQIRKEPANADLRVFLFQLLSVMGQWERALTQLNVAADLDAKTLAMAQMYREAIQCEVLRSEVFAGKRSPVVFGEPEEWLALLIESLLVTGTTRDGQAQELRQRAFEAAPASPGSLDGKASNGSRMRTCGWGRSARPSSTDDTTGCRLRGSPGSISRRRQIFAMWSGCRRISSSTTAGKPWA